VRNARLERHKARLQRTLVGRRFVAEEVEARVAVAPAQAAENLIVRPILLDDVNEVLDGRKPLAGVRRLGQSASCLSNVLAVLRPCWTAARAEQSKRDLWNVGIRSYGDLTPIPRTT
jgi:hypothetical protein